MADVKFFQASSGVIFELDIPDAGTMRRERHDEKVANGELTELVGVTPVKVPASPAEGEPYRWKLPSGTAAAARPAPTVEDETDDDSPEDDGQTFTVDPTVDGDEVPDGNIAEVLEWVAGDVTRAQSALAVEQTGKARGSLINQLQHIVDA